MEADTCCAILTPSLQKLFWGYSDKFHPCYFKEIIEDLDELIPDEVHLLDIQCVNRIHGVKKRSELFFQGSVKGLPFPVSQLCMDWLCPKTHARFKISSENPKKSKERKSTMLH